MTEAAICYAVLLWEISADWSPKLCMVLYVSRQIKNKNHEFILVLPSQLFVHVLAYLCSFKTDSVTVSCILVFLFVLSSVYLLFSARCWCELCGLVKWVDMKIVVYYKRVSASNSCQKDNEEIGGNFYIIFCPWWSSIWQLSSRGRSTDFSSYLLWIYTILGQKKGLFLFTLI